jgi:hypothetical protein
MKSFIIFSSRNTMQVIKSRRMRMEGHVLHIGSRRGSYRVLVIKPEWKIPVRRPLRRYKGNIKVNVKAIRWEDMDWNDLAQDRNKCTYFVITVMNLSVLTDVGKLFNSWGTISFSKTWPHGVHSQLVQQWLIYDSGGITGLVPTETLHITFQNAQSDSIQK